MLPVSGDVGMRGLSEEEESPELEISDSPPRVKIGKGRRNVQALTADGTNLMQKVPFLQTTTQTFVLFKKRPLNFWPDFFVKHSGLIGPARSDSIYSLRSVSFRDFRKIFVHFLNSDVRLISLIWR